MGYPVFKVGPPGQAWRSYLFIVLVANGVAPIGWARADIEIGASPCQKGLNHIPPILGFRSLQSLTTPVGPAPPLRALTGVGG